MMDFLDIKVACYSDVRLKWTEKQAAFDAAAAAALESARKKQKKKDGAESRRRKDTVRRRLQSSSSESDDSDAVIRAPLMYVPVLTLPFTSRTF